MNNLSGKVVLVTGSTAGLGRQLAIAMLSEGAHVIINGRNMEKINETRQLLLNSGWEVIAVRGDVSRPEDCRRMIGFCIREYGRLDILINNAGTGCNGLFRDTVPEAARMVLEANLFGSIYPSYYALPHIIESRGSIVFISSLAAFHGLPFNCSYSVSKMALTALSQSLRIELSGSGVHVGVMYVGFLKNGPRKVVIGSNGMLVPASGRPGKFTMSMEEAGKTVISGIRKRKPVTVFTFMGKFMYLANRLSPWLVRHILTISIIRMKYLYTPTIA
jgi:NAD(P)-dependent dehydrogenase (short-subunit alcohol dehydrogenase family)